MPMKKYKIAVLDDYQKVALEIADWSVLRDRADIAVFQNHLADPDAVIDRLLPFDVVCAMRERTPLPRHVIERLPNLKLIASTGPGNASIDVAAAGERGIAVVHTGYRPDPTIELTWGLILASAAHSAEGRPSRRRNSGLQAPAVRESRHSDDPCGVEQPYAWPGRGRRAGENEASGPVDQCIARADRRRAGVDQSVDEQAHRRRGDRRIRH